MSNIIQFTIQSTSLVHTPGLIKYAKNAYATGDEDLAIEIMAALTNDRFTKEGVIMILSGEIEVNTVDNNAIIQMPEEHCNEAEEEEA